MRDPSAADLFRALGDEHRLNILDFLASGDFACCITADGICGCDLQALTGLAQSTVSHHMKILVDAGLVEAARRGRWTYYRLNPRGVARVEEALERWRQAASSPLASAER